MGQTAAVGTQQRTDWKPEPMSERITVRCFSSYRDAHVDVGRYDLLVELDDAATARKLLDD